MMDEGLDATLQRAARGDQAAWRAIVEAYGPRVYGLVRSQCGDVELAEEVAQSAFCTIAEKITGGEGYTERGRFEAWIFRIAVNRLRDEMRRRKRRPTVALDSAAERGPAAAATGSEGAAEQAEMLGAMRGAMGRLSAADREIIELRHVAGMTYAQIAAFVDEPLGTVLARQHRALKKLRDMLVDRVGEAGSRKADEGEGESG